jgi:hypothetical protein
MRRIWNPSQDIYNLQKELDAEKCKVLALKQENEKLGFALIEWTEMQNELARLGKELDEAREANGSFPVCKNHISELLNYEGNCVLCDMEHNEKMDEGKVDEQALRIIQLEKERDRWRHTIWDIHAFVKRQSCKPCRHGNSDEDGTPSRHTTCLKWMKLDAAITEALKVPKS